MKENTASRLVDLFRVNSVSELTVDGKYYIIKQRTTCNLLLAKLANVYFRLASIPIRFWTKAKDWHRWEVESFNMLNGAQFHARLLDKGTIYADKLPGQSLWHHLNKDTLTLGMMEAAGEELRRAHDLWSGEFHGAWSHGDANLDNFIYDKKTDQIFLIDFEIAHSKSLPEDQRHANDLLVFLLDLVSLGSEREWFNLVLEFLCAYGDRHVIMKLKDEIVIPKGPAWIWWGVRTNFEGSKKIKIRLDKISENILSI